MWDTGVGLRYNLCRQQRQPFHQRSSANGVGPDNFGPPDFQPFAAVDNPCLFMLSFWSFTNAPLTSGDCADDFLEPSDKLACAHRSEVRADVSSEPKHSPVLLSSDARLCIQTAKARPAEPVCGL